jgi:protein involved in polysaccharide export with SLBB domain
MRPVLLALLLLVLTGLRAQGPDQASDGQGQALGEIQPIGAESVYQLGPADRIRISVFNQEDLSGDYSLDGKGRFSMPLIGAVKAEGLTPAQLENILTSKFKPDYLVNPRIYVQVISYRPYYLIGEALGTGAFPYIAGMTYRRAIAISGGFSYRAKKDVVYVIRAEDPNGEEIKLDVDEKVQPGDIIRVAERMF